MPIALKPSQSALLGVVAKHGEAPLTPPYALGENTKRGVWDDLGEHHARQKLSTSTELDTKHKCSFNH
jgi:hypothetical protein